MSNNKIDKVKEVILDDKLVRKVCCPGCGVWGIIDDDQFHGRVSILCECGFHETINLAELWPKEKFVGDVGIEKAKPTFAAINLADLQSKDK